MENSTETSERESHTLYGLSIQTITVATSTLRYIATVDSSVLVTVDHFGGRSTVSSEVLLMQVDPKVD